MKLVFKEQAESFRSDDFCDSLTWANADLYFVAQQAIRVCSPGMPQANKFADLPSPVNDFEAMPAVKGVSDGFALGHADGTVSFMQKSGKIQKKHPGAHKGSVIALKWSYEGVLLATAGEDGVLKIWSKNGSFRNQLTKSDRPIYSLGWSPENDAIAFCSQKTITIKPIQPSKKSTTWKAHEGIVLCVSWNPSNNLIVSTGEDCRYKTWDSFGRQQFCSAPYDYVLTAAAWAPSGEYFAVGGFGMIRLCDKTGWTYSYHKLNIGSPFKLGWSTDSTQLAGACGNGEVVLASVLDRAFFYESWEARVTGEQKIEVKDLLNDAKEEIEFKDRVVNVSMAYNELVVTTARQCYIYSFTNWNTPHILELKETVSMVIQSTKHFVLFDIANGPIIYNYDGKNISNIKIVGKSEFLSRKKLAIAQDYVAVVQNNNRLIKFYDINSGKVTPFQIDHSADIVEIALNQVENSAERKVAFVDCNKDLYLCPYGTKEVVKLAAICESFSWHLKFDMLAATSDEKFTIWIYPGAIYVDKDILQLCKVVKEAPEIGRLSQIVSFVGSVVTIRRKDGSLINEAVSPYPSVLFEFTDKQRWEKAVKLCRYVKETVIWAQLAAVSLLAKELNTAEIALAAIQMVDKVQYINYVNELPSEVSKQAALALFFKKKQLAQQILTQAKLFYRAVKLNIKLYQWEHALDLAYSFKKHVDTVVAYRCRYLERIGKEETIKKFVKAKEEVGEYSWQKIKAEIKAEKEKEKKMK